MEDSFQERERVVCSNKQTVGLLTYIGDFFNIFKAFIGTNYLSLAFAFSQSGLIFGIVGVFLIATVTDFCCQLLIKLKYVIIDRLVDQDTAHRPLSAVELLELRQKLERSISYGDVGRLTFGRWCEVVINLMVVFTQYLTTVCYFIFIGNAIFTIFPMEPAMVPLNHSIRVNASAHHFEALANGIPVLAIDNIGRGRNRPTPGVPLHRHGDDLLSRHRRAGEWQPFSPALNLPMMTSMNLSPSNRTTAAPSITTTAAPSITTTAAPSTTTTTMPSITTTTTPSTTTTTAPSTTTTTTPSTTMTTVPSTTPTTAPSTTTTTAPPTTTTAAPTVTTPVPTPAMFEKSISPSLIFLVMIPLPIFICTSLIRSMRILSPLTVVASASLFIGAVAVLVLILFRFTVKPGFKWIRFETLPLFIGQLTSAYEGIGCVLPIESSMEGNRHVFPVFLHLSVYLVFLVLTSFGVTGYLRYGDGVKQIILLNIPHYSWLTMAVDVTLIISVICTFPLQMFPVIQIVESFFFRPGMCCAPTSTGVTCDNDQGPLISEDPGTIEQSNDSFVSRDGQEVAIEIPSTVSVWKRNLLRLTITLLTMACAVGVRNSYAYVSAFSGAVGCSLLAFILPCALHIKLQWSSMHLASLILDLVIIFTSTVCSILVLVVITYKLVMTEL